MSRASSAVALFVAAALGASAAGAADQKAKATGTLKDLESREVQVVRDPPTDVRQQQAIEQYRRFLELQTDNAKMRAEATRRLGDLQVEVDESSRATGEASLSGVRTRRSDQAVRGVAGCAAGLRAQRRRHVPARARL